MTPVQLFNMDNVDRYPGKRSTTQATSVVSESQRLLSKLGNGYKKAKAQQILRLLKDQESLNQRFRDCALDDDDDENDDDEAGSDGQDSLAGNVGDAPSYGQGQDRKVTPRKSKTSSQKDRVPKKITSKVDPSRCRTSMGFYNEAEISGSADDEDGDDIGDLSDFEAETDAAVFEEREAMLGRLPDANRYGSGQKQNRRLFRLQLGDADAAIPEEHTMASTLQSAKSSRPKTGIAGSARSKQYRRTSQNDPSVKKKSQRSTISTSVSKLDGAITPRGGVRAFCDNTQDSMLLQKTPRLNDLTGGFTPRVDDKGQPYTPRNLYDNVGTSSRRHVNEIPAYLTPRASDPKTSSLKPRQTDTKSRQADLAITPRGPNQHRALINFYNGQLTPREDFAQYLTSPRFDDQSGIVTPRAYHGTKAGRMLENALYGEPSATGNKLGGSTGVCMPHTPRSTLSVDQSPIHVIPTGNQESELTPRRQKHDSMPKKRNDMSRTGGHSNLSKLSERGHPINVMKLPPLEVAIPKPAIF